MSTLQLSPPPAPRTRFTLGHERSATRPPEARGLARDEVRLLVAAGGRVDHARFRDLGRFLSAGDLLVVNTSATVPAAIRATRADGRRVDVHVAGPADHDRWVVELRRPQGDGPVRDGRPGESLRLVSGAAVTLDGPYGGPTPDGGPRLWRARFDLAGTLEEELARHGRPIAYGYLQGRWPLASYQTVFAREPGSAEMASAGRPFSASLVAELVSRGVAIAPITLHTGVSSLEAGEAPPPERYVVPAATADLVNLTRQRGRRVVAVGTTVTRALETVADVQGSVRPGRGWTDLVLGPDRPARTVDGLVTGWHAPEASHLLLLEAVAGPALVQHAYEEALDAGYLWHEFGDSALLLPDP